MLQQYTQHEKQKQQQQQQQQRQHQPHQLPFNLWSFNIIGFFCIIVLMAMVTNVQSIDCFKCISYNGGNNACDDPFHNNFSTAFLEAPCMGGRKGRDGLFPATSCIKIAGYYDDTGETITVRGCALDSGTLTTDTEIVRMSHCGKFYYDDRYVHGCLQSCNDGNGCNAASTPIQNISKFQFQYFTIAFWTLIANHMRWNTS